MPYQPDDKECEDLLHENKRNEEWWRELERHADREREEDDAFKDCIEGATLYLWDCFVERNRCLDERGP
jgi:hypothetical protein